VKKKELKKILAEVRGLVKQIEEFIETLEDMVKEGVEA